MIEADVGAIVPERSTAVMRVNFKNENGEAIIPTEATWTLSKPDSTVVNNRFRVPITSLATSVEVVLSGDDLKIQKGRKIQERIFTVEAKYDSDLGTGLPFNGSCIFKLTNMVGVPK